MRDQDNSLLDAGRLRAGPDSAETAAAARVGNEAPPVDLPVALDRVEGDAELLGELLELLGSEVRDGIADIGRGAETSDIELVTRSAHRVKGAALNLAAAPLSQRADRIEQAAQERRLNAVPSLLEALVGEFKRFSTFFAAYRDEHME